MKIIVMSDSHGDLEMVQAISTLPENLIVNALFHCGDSELPFDHPVFGQMVKIRGNCDTDARFPNNVVVKVDEKTIYAVHGHEHNVNQTLMTLHYDAIKKNADIVLFGHTHLYGAYLIDGILFVNPGSTQLPRGGKKATYAIVEWNEKIRITYRNLQHEVIDTQEFNNI